MTPEALEAARAAIVARYAGSPNGVAMCAAWSDLTDSMVRHVAGRAADAAGVAVVATGGYGRRELAPGSDVDLLFLTEDTAAAEPVVQQILRGLWDLRFQVGFATRNISESIQLAEADRNTATALLTARTVEGPGDAGHALRAALMARFTGPRGDALLEALEEGMHRRHERYGGSVYLLEPNLKQSPGGLRDLNTILWAVTVAYNVAGWHDLLPRGVCSPRAARELGTARQHLLRVRNALHLAAPHGGDRLTFEHQEMVARALGYGDDREAVERFMAAYYEQAAVVKKRAALLLERCRERGRPVQPVRARLKDPCFVEFDGHLSVDDPRLFERDHRHVMRLFATARRERLRIHGFARERVMEVVPTLRTDDAWRRDPAVAAWFLELLTALDDPMDALGDLHESGVLGAMIPEFNAVTHRTHHDLYHLYTVDIHTLHAIRRLKVLESGELSDREPLLTQAMAQIEDKVPLYLGLLMHDAGKALGRGHAVKGARLVPGIARRLGLTPAQARRAEWLVRDHLLMAHLSQRRDLSDDRLIRQFCRQVGDEQALAQLFVLTWADASTTGPQAYTDWKAALLAELYARASARFKRGLDLYEDPGHRVDRLRRAVTRYLLRHGDTRVGDVNSEVDRFFASLPTAYFQKTRARTISLHLELLKRLEETPPVVLDVVPRLRRGYAQLHVAGHERPGLLAAVTGVLAAHHLDVINAELHVTSEGRALYIYRVREAEAGGQWGAMAPQHLRVPAADEARWAPVREDLRRVIAGEADVEALLDAAHPTEGRFAWPPGPPVPTRVACDQAASETCTVVDVYTRDRAGLLYSMVRILDTHDLRIHLARISTEGDAVHDTFYLEAREGGKLDDAAAEHLAGALDAALGRVG